MRQHLCSKQPTDFWTYDKYDPDVCAWCGIKRSDEETADQIDLLQARVRELEQENQDAYDSGWNAAVNNTLSVDGLVVGPHMVRNWREENARLRKVVDIFNEHRRLAHSLKRDNPQLFEFFEAVGAEMDLKEKL